MNTQELKARAFDLIMAQQKIAQELQQIQIAIYQTEKQKVAVGKPGVPVTGGNETGENN